MNKIKFIYFLKFQPAILPCQLSIVSNCFNCFQLIEAMANKIPRSYAPGDNKDYDKKKPGNEESQYPLPLVVAQPQQKHVAYVFYYYHSGSGRRSEWMTLCKDTMQCNFRSVLVLN